MCFTSVIYDQWKPYIPPLTYPPTQWPITITPVPPATLPATPITITPEQLQQLLDAFHKAVEAAEVLDRLTNQPDCVDPDKAKLMDRVKELEKQLQEVRNAE